jgi:hypothetical protein
MNHLTYKLFESVDNTERNKRILRKIRESSYIIEDDGYIIVYFVTFEETGKPDHTFAIGSTGDIDNEIENGSGWYHRSNKRLKKVFLEIVKELPRTTKSEEIKKELENNDLISEYKDKYQFDFPEYNIEVNYLPAYIIININNK